MIYNSRVGKTQSDCRLHLINAVGVSGPDRSEDIPRTSATGSEVL